MILPGSGLLNRTTLLYRESIDDSNILRISVDLYQAWNKPEKAEEWRAKLPQSDSKTEQ
jgi:hypothetical protein